MGSFTMCERCDRSAIVYLISLVYKVHAGMSGVCSGVVGPDRFIYVVGSAIEKNVAFSMASLASDIRVSSSVSIALSEICLSALVFSSSARCICTPSVAAS